MIIVTGTMRAGTSMWMQILKSAGFPVIGSEFPGKWQERIGKANANGFFESHLRNGIYHRTNPHPVAGTYLKPEATRQHAVKVFAQGLVRTDVAFVDRVVLSLRPFREYVASIDRLMEMERRARSAEAGRELPLPAHIPHVLRWWDDNFSAFRDALVRGYPTHAMAYDTVLDDPDALGAALRWLGAPCVEDGVRCVDARQRTQTQPADECGAAEQASGDAHGPVDDASVAVFDELYERVRTARGFDSAFVARLNAVDQRLRPRIVSEQAAAKRLAARRGPPWRPNADAVDARAVGLRQPCAATTATST